MPLKAKNWSAFIATFLFSVNAAAAAQTKVTTGPPTCPTETQLYTFEDKWPSLLAWKKEDVEQFSKSTVRLEWKSKKDFGKDALALIPLGSDYRGGHCTGILIDWDKRHILTAEHCLVDDKSAPPLTTTQMTTGLQVRFGFRHPIKEMPKDMLFDIDRVVERGSDIEGNDGELDYAILEFKIPKEAKISGKMRNRWLTPAKFSLTVPVDTNSSVPFFLSQHPANSPRSFAFGSARIVQDGSIVRYGDAYSRKGSSGAPLHDKKGYVFAMHVNGFDAESKKPCGIAGNLQSKAITLRAIAQVSPYFKENELIPKK